MTRPIPIGTAEWHPERRALTRVGRAIRLTRLERGLLHYLAENIGHVISSERLLQDVWGYAPTVRSRAVDNAMSRLRKKLGADARQIETVYGKGFCLLPTAQRVLVGRHEELGMLTELVERHSVVNVYGLGGVGKSSLVRDFAAKWTEHVWLEFHDPQTPEEVECRVAEALGLSPQAIDRIPERLRAVGSPLVVFDGAEHLGPWLVKCVRNWLGDAPEGSVVMTSRVLFGDEPGLELGPLSSAAALELLSRSAGPANHDARLAELVELVDRLPLVVELVAARLQERSPAELVAWLRQDGAAILDGPTRQLSTTLQGCWSLLEAGEQHCLSVAALMGNRFRAEPVQRVAGLSPASTLDALERLLRTGMLQRHGRFYSMLDMVRSLASEHVSAPMRGAFVEWAAECAETMSRDEYQRSHDELSELVIVFLRALEWAEAPHDRARLLLGIRVHDDRYGPLTRTAAAFRALPTEALSYELTVAVWRERGLIHIDSDQHEDAYRCLKRASELAVHLPTAAERIRTQICFVNVVRMLRGTEAALPMARQVQAEIDSHDVPLPVRVFAVSCIEGCLTVLGEFEEAHRHVLRAVVMLEHHPDAQARHRVRLGYILSQLGEEERARRELEAALAHARHAELDRTFIMAGRQLGDLHLYGGDLKGARGVYTAVAEVAERVDDPEGRLGARLGLAAVTALEGADEGLRDLEEVREQAILVGRVREASVASLEVAKLRHRRGDWETAEAAYRECMALVEPIGWNWVTAKACTLLALLLRTVKRPEEARAMLAKAEPGSRVVRSVRDAVAAVLEGDEQRAARILYDGAPRGLAAQVTEFIGMLPPDS